MKRTNQNKQVLAKIQLKDLDKRIAQHKNDESVSYTWPETKKLIQKIE